MNFLKYFKQIHAQKQINKWAKKYKDKKIVIYGSGEYFQVLQDNFDLSKLNIVGISDKKFENSKDFNTTKYLPLEPAELKEFDYDAILVALYDDTELCDYLKYELILNTKNEDCDVNPIVEPTFWYLLKTLLGK